jgi:hypothetical protein
MKQTFDTIQLTDPLMARCNPLRVGDKTVHCHCKDLVRIALMETQIAKSKTGSHDHTSALKQTGGTLSHGPGLDLTHANSLPTANVSLVER